MSEFEQANLISWVRHLACRVAFLYLKRSPVKRPSIKEVVGMLRGDSEPPYLPVEFSPSPPSNLFKSRKKARGWSSSSTSSASAVSSVSSSIYFELWHACAGPLTSLPKKGSAVYFPQGHIEQAVSSSSMPCLEMPIFGLQPQIFCRVVNVQLLANKKNDEVYTQVTLFLEPENNVAKLLEIALDDRMDKEPNVPLPCLEVSFLELLPIVPVEHGGVELDSHSSCNLQGYRYLLFDSNKNMSRASPPGKVATLAKESLLAQKKLREEVDLEKSITKKDNPSPEKDLEVCIRANNNSWVIARVTRGKELYMVLEKASETLLYASDAVEKFSNSYHGFHFSFLIQTGWVQLVLGDPKGVPDEILAYDSSPDQRNSANAIFCLWMAVGNILGFSPGSNGNWHSIITTHSDGSVYKAQFRGGLVAVVNDVRIFNEAKDASNKEVQLLMRLNHQLL
ncbi:hypothetical protein GIB67_028152 [Kingdonia uniflora]|uniref:Uncharacterized protein n=1 Tax=Kingdonia uniflora TaxID=39325 RepID=A0A7J7KZQ6_9MAGN|nr:hypothetical protein GIB67_028152 [Kingdonia uniflora]